MKLTKLTIKNFRGFEEETIDFDDITVFVGENNTGKTTILDAIRFVPIYMADGERIHLDFYKKWDCWNINNDEVMVEN
jgi:predicted ATP-dependent endonuclease of OLD family